MQHAANLSFPKRKGLILQISEGVVHFYICPVILIFFEVGYVTKVI